MSQSNKVPSIFEETEALTSSGSKFLRLEPGQTVTLKFDPYKARVVDRTFKDKTSKAIEYPVTDINNGQDKLFTLSPQWAKQLNTLLKEGFNTIRVGRKGSGLDTSYSFVPITPTKMYEHQPT
jgi:hypothetical protein